MDANGHSFEIAQHAILSNEAGRAVPMKFKLGGDHGLNVIAAGSPTSVQVECPADTPISAIETTNTAGAGSLTYDAATGTYNYVWKTETNWAGTCRTFNLVLDDGTPHRAVFRFVR